MQVRVDIRFDGLMADAHQVDMKLLGQSLIGLDRAVGDTLFMATEGRLPKPRERRSLEVRVEAPRAACLEITGVVGAAAGVLPIAYEAIKHPGTKFLFEFLSFMLKKKGGKPKEAERNLHAAFEALRDANAAMVSDRQHERNAVYASEERWRTFSLDLVDKLTPSLKQIVAPVGPSSESLTLGAPPGSEATIVDTAMADAVRSGEAVEVGEMTKMTIRVDGMIKHSRQLRVELEQVPGRYLIAEVRDPAFDVRPNEYTRAYEDDGLIAVDAKPTFKNGELHKLHIMNVIGRAA